MQRKILHKSMGNSDIGVDMVLQKEKKKTTAANQLIFCICPLLCLLSFRFSVLKLWMDK